MHPHPTPLRGPLLLAWGLALATAAGCGVEAKPPPAPPAAPTAPASDAREVGLNAFESLWRSRRAPGEGDPHGGWVPAPAVADVRPDALRGAGAAVLLEAAGSAPTRGDLEAARRQAWALALLGVEPRATEAAAVARLLDEGRLREPWRAALVLGATGDVAYAPTVTRVLDAAPFEFGGAQAALALGLCGTPAAATRLEAFVRANYGRRGYDFGKHALRTLAGRDEPSRGAVVEALFSLFLHHPSGIRTDGGLQWHEDHPERVRYIRTTVIELLRGLGTRREAERLAAVSDRLVDPPERLRAYLQASLALMRARPDP